MEVVQQVPKLARPGGRTARVTEQLLDATVELIAEGGLDSVTYDGVAKRAGASRATVHRKWPQRDDLLRDALLRFAETRVPTPDSGNLRDDLVELLRQLGRLTEQPIGRALLAGALTAARDDPLRAVSRDVLDARLGALAARIDRAVAAGELPKVNVPFLNNLLCGPVYLHVARDGRSLTRRDARRIVDVVLGGIAARPFK